MTNLLTPKSKHPQSCAADIFLYPLAISKYPVPLQVAASARESIIRPYSARFHNQNPAPYSSGQPLPIGVPSRSSPWLLRVGFVPGCTREWLLTGPRAESRRSARLK